MITLKTKLTSFYFDISDDNQKAEYDSLCQHFKDLNIKCFETCGNGSHYLSFADKGIDVELETKHIFNNQWNTAPIAGQSDNGLRVFDFAMDACLPNKNIKKGHYLTITDEMVTLRDNTQACGYCGNQDSAQKSNVFCPKCIGSEYLEEKDLHLTRMQAVSNTSNRAKLSKGESEHLLPLYITAQTKGSDTRAGKKKAKQYQDLKTEADKTIAEAIIKRDGFLWLMDNDINIDNCIYYSHTDTFSFGWRHAVSKTIESDLLDVLVEFPYNYEIKAVEDIAA